jgi:hypothetical protein
MNALAKQDTVPEIRGAGAVRHPSADVLRDDGRCSSGADLLAALRAEIGAGVGLSDLPASRRAAVDGLLPQVGTAGFYGALARLEPQEGAAWRSMAGVQRRFAAAEAGLDPTTRAWCDSMRLTLHAAAVECVANPRHREGQSLYARFIELHPTAFHQNGGWFDNQRLSLAGALELAFATPLGILAEVPRLLLGAALTDPAAIKGADWVRRARRACSSVLAPSREG